MTVIKHFCDWLAATALSQRFQDLKWFVPMVQTIHILSVALVLTSMGLLDAKLLGFSRQAPSLDSLASTFMPWIWRALGILLTTGTLLTITEPSRELLNSAFRAKMLMVATMAALLRMVQLRLQRDTSYWERSPQRRMAARAVGACGLCLAAGIIVAGRWIAYI